MSCFGSFVSKNIAGEVSPVCLLASYNYYCCGILLLYYYCSVLCFVQGVQHYVFRTPATDTLLYDFPLRMLFASVLTAW